MAIPRLERQPLGNSVRSLAKANPNLDALVAVARCHGPARLQYKRLWQGSDSYRERGGGNVAAGCGFAVSTPLNQQTMRGGTQSQPSSKKHELKRTIDQAPPAVRTLTFLFWQSCRLKSSRTLGGAPPTRWQKRFSRQNVKP
ncbi:hypothetical protein QFZ94_005032 [Paraburkholderia sp. JPY465]